MRSIQDHPLIQMLWCRFREFVREPGALFWVFAFPMLISLALGIAFRNQEPAALDVAVVDPNLAAEGLPGSAVDAVFAAPMDKALRPVRYPSEELARKALQSGRVTAVLFASDFSVGAEKRILVDDTQANARIVAALLRLSIRSPGAAALEPQIRELTVQGVGTRYIDFLIPGVLGMNVMSSSIWGVGWSLVQLRTRKLMKRLVATPMKRSHLLLSFVAYRLVLAIIETVVLATFAVLVFGVKLQGSPLALGAVVLLGVLAFSGLALLTASRAQNAETASGLMNLANMPMLMLSGVFFSSDKFPDWMQPFIQALPLTALNNALRAIFNEGATLASQGTPLLVMAAWAVACFVISLRVFRWN